MLEAMVGFALHLSHQEKIAEQLSRINEQLVIKNRRWNRFWKIVGAILLGYVLLSLIGFWLFSANTSSVSSSMEVDESVMDEGYEDMGEKNEDGYLYKLRSTYDESFTE